LNGHTGVYAQHTKGITTNDSDFFNRFSITYVILFLFLIHNHLHPLMFNFKQLYSVVCAFEKWQTYLSSDNVFGCLFVRSSQTDIRIRILIGVVLVVVVWWLDLQLSMQSIPITTNVLSSNPTHGEVYSIQHYMIKFVSDLRQVSGFHRELRFSPPLTLWVRTRFMARCIRYIQHYVIKFVSDLRPIGGYLWVLRFPPPVKLTAMI
jgi:hypothetical protein